MVTGMHIVSTLEAFRNALVTSRHIVEETLEALLRVTFGTRCPLKAYNVHTMCVLKVKHHLEPDHF